MKSICLTAFACVVLGAGVSARAATVFDSTQLLAQTAAADAQLPPPFDFTVSADGSYVLRLSDLNLPVTFESLRAIVTRDLKIVASVQVTPGTAGQSVTAEQTFNAAAGKYRVHVLPIVADGAEAGSYGISIAQGAGGPLIAQTVQAVVAQPAAPSDSTLAQTTFDIEAAGSYQLAVADHGFPAPLSELRPRLFRQSSSGPIEVLSAAGAFSVPSPGIYAIAIYARAGSQHAGLFSARVTGGSLAGVVHASTQTVGRVRNTSMSIPSAAQYTLRVADVRFPSALDSSAAAVVQDGVLLGAQVGAGSMSFAAAAGAAQLFEHATTPTAGVMSTRFSSPTHAAHAGLYAIDESSDPKTSAIYVLSPSQAAAAGAHRLVLKDYDFPLALQSLDVLVVQGGEVLTRTDAGVHDLTLQAGAVTLYVATQAAAGTPDSPGNGLFGVTLAAGSGGASLLESTQGVGGLFRSQPVQIDAAGAFDLTLVDLEFPAKLRTSALAITRGTELVGRILGAGVVPREQLAPGTYVFNFLGQPAADASYGTYGIKIADSAPLPTITLTASPESVASGQRSTLHWSAANATSCTATGAWSGARPISGDEPSAVLTATSTFELSCTGAGGTGKATVSVGVTAASSSGSKGGGGGGSFDWLLLGLLGSLVVRRHGRRGRRA